MYIYIYIYMYIYIYLYIYMYIYIYYVSSFIVYLQYTKVCLIVCLRSTKHA